jgi:hypothetical protein
MPPILSYISLDAMKNKYRSWKETTSTSPSGRHLGHRHALLKADGLVRDSDELQHLDVARNEIWGMHHMMLNYGLKHGYCFERWKKVVTTLIEKDPGDPHIHCLCVIHLYEYCYNLLLGMTYQITLYAAVDHNVLHKGNYGSRPCQSSLDPIGIEVLPAEYSDLTRLAHLKFSNDAEACYDPIIVILYTIISLCHGVPSEVTTTQGDMLKLARYFILDTDESFAFEDDEVIMDASTNVFDVDDEHNLLQFTDRLRGQHTAKAIMSLKLLKLLRLTGAPHYAYTSIMDIFADALASKIVTAGATFRQHDTAIKHFAKRFRLEKLYPTTLTKHMNGCSYPVVLHDAEAMVQSLLKSSLMVEENMLFPDMDNPLPPHPLRLRLLPMLTRARYSVLRMVIFVLDPMMFCARS